MKNFEMRYSANGTSALQPKFERKLSSADNIIEFPGQQSFCTEHTTLQRDTVKSEILRRPSMHECIMETDMVQSLRYGSARGCAYGRISTWQAVAVGVVFSACALASMFLGL